MHMTKRYTISVSDWQAAALEEIAALDEVSVSHVVRDCLRGMLPKLLDLTRFLHDPTTSSGDALALADDMERLLARLSGGAVAGDAGAAPPASPPSSNTGAQSPDLGNS